MRSGNLLEEALAAARRAVTRIEVQSYETATLGWRQSATVVLLEVPGRPNFVYITKNGTRTEALNEANVPLNAFLPVKVRLENNTLVIKGQNVAATNALTNLPPSPYGVPTHPHALSGLSDVLLTSLADGQILAWDATAGKWVNVTEAGALVISVNGQTGDVVLDSDDIPEGSTNLYISDVELIKLAGIETAADVTDQANVAAAIDGSTEATSFADANKLALLVSGALRWISGANLKATLKAYFDTLYGLLGSANAWTAINTYSNDIIAGVIRRAVETGSLILMGGTSTTQGPYIQMVGKDAGGAVDGDIQYIATIESGGHGHHTWFAYNGTAFVQLKDLSPAGILTLYKQLDITNGGATDSTIKAGPLEIQGFAVNNNWIADNIYFDGTSFRYRANGLGALHYFTAGGWRLYTAPNNVSGAGAAATLTQRFIAENTGNVGIGNMTTVRGRLHVHDGTSGKMFVTVSLPDGTAVTVIPDGTGDVTYYLTANAIIRPSSGGVASGPHVVAPGGFAQIYYPDFGVNEVRLSVSAGGAVTVQRIAGTRTYTITLELMWQ